VTASTTRPAPASTCSAPHSSDLPSLRLPDSPVRADRLRTPPRGKQWRCFPLSGLPVPHVSSASTRILGQSEWAASRGWGVREGISCEGSPPAPECLQRWLAASGRDSP
jgi:hypothetical protein